MSTKRLAALLHEARIGCVRNGVVGPPLWCQAKHGDHAASLIAAGVTLAATPAPLDVERLTDALTELPQTAWDPCMAASVDEVAAAIAAAYAEETP